MYYWFGGSSKDYNRLNSNEFLIWKAIEWGCDNNFSIFDFGGGGHGKEIAGIRKYKEAFGSKTFCTGRYTKSLSFFHKIKDIL